MYKRQLQVQARRWINIGVLMLQYLYNLRDVAHLLGDGWGTYFFVVIQHLRVTIIRVADELKRM